MKVLKEESHEVLPSEIFYEILPRLALKTLIRFKCVCKQWLSMIQDQLLARNFLVHHAGDHQNPMALISFPQGNFNGSLFFSLDLETGLARPIHSLNEPPFPRARVAETVNGLICFDLDDVTYLCNLSTGEIASLPAARPDFPVNSSVFMPPFSSLGFDPEKREYKIMKTWPSLVMDDLSEIRSCHKIMKLGDRVWRNTATGPIEFRFGGSVFLNGALHYLTLDTSDKKIIVAFDVALEEFSEMSLPDKSASSGNNSSLVLFRGHLALLDSEHLEDKGLIMVYELKDYENKSWGEQRIVLPLGWRELVGEVFQAFHVTAISTDEILLTPKMVLEQFYVLLYDTETKNLRRLEIAGLPEAQLALPLIVDCTPIEYIENILSFPGANYQ